MLTDKDLVDSILKDGAISNFELIYDRYAKKVYNTCLYYFKDRYEAEDVTQDIFVKLYLNLNKFKGESKFSTWLYPFVRNYCLNYLKRNNSKKIQDKSVHYLDVAYNISEKSDFNYDEELMQGIELALKQISANEKSVFLLKYREGLSIKQISLELNIGESAVKMRLKRAKSHLKEVMPVAV